jgi:hypothetical protein
LALLAEAVVEQRRGDGLGIKDATGLDLAQ